MTEEIWRPAPNAEGLYEVSNLGRVRSLDRWVHHGKPNKPVFYKGKVLSSGRYTTDGYNLVVLRINKKSKCWTVHRLVATVFLPNPKNLPLVRHLNDDPNDNRAENLAWGTYSENFSDMCCWKCGAPYTGRTTLSSRRIEREIAKRKGK